LTESANVEGALFRGFLGNLTRQFSTVFCFFSPPLRDLIYLRVLGSFSIDLMDFWAIDFFFTSNFGMDEEGSFCRKGRNRFEGGVLGSFSIDFMGFSTIEFFHPHFWGWL